MLEIKGKNISADLLLGLSAADLVYLNVHNCQLHPLAVEPLQSLALAAEKAGFALAVASSYRSFDRQLSIWNNKARGLRPVLDSAGGPLDISCLSDREKIFAILRWSALPGASRHHWGTDLDIYDSSRISVDYSLQLTVEETEGEGPFAEFHQWLSAELECNSRGFIRPYRAGVGGIAPEPWHLSYAPVANLYAAQLTEAMLRAQLEMTDIALKEVLLQNLSDIYQDYIQPYVNGQENAKALQGK